MSASPAHRQPIIGITADITEPAPDSPRATCALTYSRAVEAAGGIPFILPPITSLIPAQLALCHAFILTGGDDPRTEPFGVPTHPKATPLHPLRQEYETALLAALERDRQQPVLGICLGMQLMALTRGGRLNQHMPDNVPTAAAHHGNQVHAIQPVEPSVQLAGCVTSHHRQAVWAPGSMRVIATAPDGIIEAIDDPTRPFYLGVQWHPERTDDPALGPGIFAALIHAARERANA